MTADTKNTPTPIQTVFARVAPWLFVLFSESFPPLAVSVLAGYLLFFIPQSQEVLLGILSSIVDSQSSTQSNTHLNIAFWPLVWLLLTTIALALTVWYSSRLLVTIDSKQRVPNCLNNSRSRSSLKQAIQDVPRLLGSFAAAFVVSGFLSAQRLEVDAGWRLVSLFLAATMLPVCAAYAAQLKGLWRCFLTKPTKNRWIWSIIIVLAVLVFEVGVILLAIPAHSLRISVLFFEAAAALIPACLFVFFVFRRRITRRLNDTWQLPEAAAEMAFQTGVKRLVMIVFFSGLALGALGYGPVSIVRPFGSAAVVILFFCSFLGIVAAATLFVRRLTHGIPGAALACALLVAILFAWQKELMGNEKLDPPQIDTPPYAEQQKSTPGAKIVVNAYGGGLRAAVYTALLLADLDDQSCGDFGGRLGQLSGVSGGSLGIAAYLVLRQDFIATGGWGDCKNLEETTRQRKLRELVKNALVKDHLSVSLGRFLALDVWPFGSAQRGQALIESWQDGIMSSLEQRHKDIKIDSSKKSTKKSSSLGLATPLDQLNGGLSIAPTVYFNSTDIDSGRRVWLSNNGGSSALPAGDPAIKIMSVAQAVLHSARFPLVTPAGSQTLDGDMRRLIDGGYADNSGAATLADHTESLVDKLWISIDGNPSLGTCSSIADTASAPPIWSGLSALLNVRASQADIAVVGLQKKHPGVQSLSRLTFDLDAAFAQTISDKKTRCNQVRKFHTPPLGWYMTVHSMDSVNLSIAHSTSKACERMKTICRSVGR